MSHKWIKEGDYVKVISGNDRGQVGKVLARAKMRIVVQGVNIRKKHVKKQSQGAGGEILSIERPVHISNVSLCDSDGNKIKLKVKATDKKKDLVYEKDGKETVYRSLRK